MMYVARPVPVNAYRISRVTGSTPPAGMVPVDSEAKSALQCFLENGTTFTPTFGMISRMLPKPGDYVVTQDDGYTYLNPKAVFERKYRPATDTEQPFHA